MFIFLEFTLHCKSAAHRILALAICLAIGTTCLPAIPVQAFDIGTIIGVGAEHAQLNKQLTYLDNEGRDEFMNQLKEKYGVNTDARVNAMTSRVIGNLSKAIAQTDPSITKKPYHYFVNNDTSFNAFCTIGHNISVNIGLFAPLNYEADALGFDYATSAGYNPGGGAALWQRMLDKGGDVKTSGVMALFNDHPTTISRRNTNSTMVTKWSNGIVKVNDETGTISIRGKDWYTPASISSMSRHERAYLIAGNLSAIYHQTQKPQSSVYVNNSNVLCVDKQPIVDLSPEKQPKEITQRLKQLL